MFNLSRPVKHSKERRKRLPISEVISRLKVAGEEHLATAVLLRRPAEAKPSCSFIMEGYMATTIACKGQHPDCFKFQQQKI
jgi:hypothetical protein